MKREQWLTAGAILACFLGSRFVAHWLYLPLGLAILGRFWRKEERQRLRAWAALGAGVALLWLAVYSFLFYAPAQGLWDQTETYSVTALDYPSETAYSHQLDVRYQPEFGFPVKIRLYTALPCEEVKPGDQLEVTARLISPQEAFEEAPSYYTSQGIYAVSAKVTELTVVPVEETPLWLWPKMAAHRMREVVEALFPGEAQGLMMALLTGEQGELSDSLSSQLSRTGLSHLAAVSGLHVSFLVGIVMLLPGDRRARSLIAIPILALFCAMTGARPSIVRATVMGIAMLLSPFFRRDGDAGASLRLALLALLVHNPFSIESAGLQMSFAAVGGILLTSKALNRWLMNRKPVPQKRWAVRLKQWICGSLSLTVGALVLTLPLVVWYFGTISLIAPLSNLLAIWAAALIFSGGLAVTMLGFLCMPLARVLALPVRGLVAYLLGMVKLLSHVPFCSITTQVASYRLWLVVVYGVILLLFFRKRQRKRAGVYCGCLAALLFVLIFAHRGSLTVDVMTVQVLDVGQGQSVLFLSETEAVAVDCGGDDAGNVLADALGDIGETQLDLLLLTHFDSDHVNGVPQLLERVTVREIAIPDIEDDSGGREELERLAGEFDVDIRTITEDETVSFGLATMELFAPVGEDSDNNQCLSVHAQMGDFDALVTGDMDSATEERLLEKHQLPAMDVLVAGHHGSASSTGEALLEAVRPETVVISAGEDNPYGHPAQETLERLEAAGCTVRRTDQEGTVTITTEISY